jgi:hypothetical protein
MPGSFAKNPAQTIMEASMAFLRSHAVAARIAASCSGPALL